jgi:hypothetical protein
MAAEQLHDILTNLSHQLTIPDDVLKTGDEYMQKIFLLLQKYSSYKLDRCRLTGGVGKKTSISLNYDYDCVIYVNDVDPQFKDLLGEWEDILTLKLDHPISELKLTRFSIQFKIGEIEFDVLPAPNYAGPDNDITLQARRIMEIVSKDQCVSKKEKTSYI